MQHTGVHERRCVHTSLAIFMCTGTPQRTSGTPHTDFEALHTGYIVENGHAFHTGVNTWQHKVMALSHSPYAYTDYYCILEAYGIGPIIFSGIGASCKTFTTDVEARCDFDLWQWILVFPNWNKVMRNTPVPWGQIIYLGVGLVIDFVKGKFGLFFMVPVKP